MHQNDSKTRDDALSLKGLELVSNFIYVELLLDDIILSIASLHNVLSLIFSGITQLMRVLRAHSTPFHFHNFLINWRWCLNL